MLKAFFLTTGLVVAVVLVAALSFDEGEVWNLHTVGEQGAEYETQLWMVEVDGQPFLRAGDPGSRWLERIGHEPRVILERTGDERRYRAVPMNDDRMLERVNTAMAEKYGYADRVVHWLVDTDESIVVRLDPAPGQTLRGSSR